MLSVRTALLLIILSSLSACTYSNTYSYGNDFNSSQVQNIVKNVTTKSEIIQLFGEPFTKTTLSENSEKWIYSYSGGKASAQAFTMKTKSEGITKILDILIKDDVVVNYTYSEPKGPNFQMNQ